MNSRFKISLSLFVLVTTLCSSTLVAQTGNSILGKWRDEKEVDRHVEIYLGKDGLYYGKLIYEGKKKENIGQLIFKKLAYDATTKSFKGIMSPPNSSMEINSIVTIESADKFKIIGKKFLITKTILFDRIKE